MNLYTAKQLLPITRRLDWERGRLSYMGAYGRLLDHVSRVIRRRA